MADDDEQKVRTERARTVGLFRYRLIREAADPAHSTKARGRLVRQIAAGEHVDPFGRLVRVSRQTVDRWIRDWRTGGFDALVPSPRQSSARTPAEVLDLATALKRENPDRTAAGVRRILRAQLGWAPDERTLCRHFARLGLMGPVGRHGQRVRPVRSRPAQRAVDRRRPARTAGRRPQNLPVRLHR